MVFNNCLLNKSKFIKNYLYANVSKCKQKKTKKNLHQYYIHVTLFRENPIKSVSAILFLL